MRKLTYIFCIALFFLVSLLSVCNVHAMDQREGINILIEAKKMSKNQQHDEAIKKLEFLIQEIQDDPRLSKQFYTKASKMIVQINRMKEKDLKRKQREEKRNVEYDERAAAKAAAITAIDQSKINDGKYLKNEQWHIGFSRGKAMMLEATRGFLAELFNKSQEEIDTVLISQEDRPYLEVNVNGMDKILNEEG